MEDLSEMSSNTLEKTKRALRGKCPCSEFFWSVFSRIRTECREIRSISPYSVQIRENTDQKNLEHGHFLRSLLNSAKHIFTMRTIISFLFQICIYWLCFSIKGSAINLKSITKYDIACNKAKVTNALIRNRAAQY